MDNNFNKLKEILQYNDFPAFGICNYSNISKTFDVRSRNLIPYNAHSVIVFAFPYYVGDFPNRNISRYAIVQDYHIIVKNLLKKLSSLLTIAFEPFSFVPFSDNSPFPEVEIAVKSGLGFIGLNHLLITEKYGSFIFIGEIATDMPLPQTPSLNKTCLKCMACIKKCPGKAILKDKIDMNSCLSHITQKKGVVSTQEKTLIKQNKLLWGCDICQDVCPHNKNVPITYIEDFKKDIIPFLSFNNIDILVKTRAFGFRGPSVLKRNHGILYDK
ncbi:MAG: DUF1730 domain-containing protein [Oscillospiraceae bacterium]|nr:DUF1730 domain-containing protein [Oscillospiraceae bacterium]